MPESRIGILAHVATLSRRDVEHVAYLARLGLSDDEVALLEGQLNHILEQYAVLSELDTDDIAPTAQVIELENVMRADEVRPGFTVQMALANAPERHGDYFLVPAVLGEVADVDPPRRDDPARLRSPVSRPAPERGPDAGH